MEQDQQKIPHIYEMMNFRVKKKRLCMSRKGPREFGGSEHELSWWVKKPFSCRRNLAFNWPVVSGSVGQPLMVFSPNNSPRWRLAGDLLPKRRFLRDPR